MSEATTPRMSPVHPTNPGRPRLAALDRLLLFSFGTIFLACFALHVNAVWTDTLLYHAFYVSAADSTTGAPMVEGFILELENPGDLQVGDRILRIGGVDMRGANPFQVSARTHGKSQGGIVPMEIERGGVRQRISVSLVQPEVPWFMIPLVVGLAVVAVIVLLRSPGSGPSRLLFIAFMSIAISHCYFTGPSAIQLYAGIFTFHVWNVISFFTLALWAIYFPPDLDPRHRIRRRWALVGALWIPPRTTQYLGGPLPLDSVSEQMLIVDALLFAWLLGVLAWNYQHASSLGRRRVKWAVLGMYLGMLPFVFIGLLVALNPGIVWLRVVHSWAVVFAVLVPIGFLIAIARYNLLDIDRVISGTASYTIVLVLFALAGEALLEPFAGLLGTRLGLDPSASQLIFVGALAAAAVPLQRAWRPYVDRLFFSAGRSHTEKIERLLEELPTIAAAGDDLLVNAIGARVESIFDPLFCIVYKQDGESFDPAFTGSDIGAQSLCGERSQAVADLLGKRIGPIQLDSRGGSRRHPAIARDLHAILGIDAAVLVPLRPHGAVSAFLCLGPKRSGDVYTSTDLSLLATVAHHAVAELSADL